MVRHSREDALTDREFESLVDAAHDLDEPFESEATFILFAGGRLGLRATEITHIREPWINWQRSMIEIPQHDPCDCGYCYKQARQSVDYRPDETTFEEQFDGRWRPKTSKGARSIPFDFDDRVQAVVEAFFDDREEYPKSRVSINRRVTQLAESAGMDPDDVYPHALRATAATFHAYRGVTAAPLQALMGWAKLATAEKYIRLSGGATADALKDAHSD